MGRTGSEDRPPRVWALLGPRAGDNNQVLALAEALGGTVVPQALHYDPRQNWRRLLPAAFVDAGLTHLDVASRALLAPPWPDVVIGVGWRSVPVARWIRARAGSRCRLVQIGRPRCHPAYLDLVLTTPQYGVPRGPQVVELPLPLTRQTPARLAAAAAQWRERLQAWPAPRLALLLGGDSWPFRLRAEDAVAACQVLLARAAARGGSVLVIGSRRTPATVEQAVRAALVAASVPAAFLSGTGDGNPYAGLLALAEEITVTADSAAMIADAVVAGKPVGLVPVQAAGAGGLWLRLVRSLRLADAGEGQGGWLLRAAGRARGVLARHGLVGWPRDLWFLWREIGHQGLVGSMEAPRRGDAPAMAAVAAARITLLLPAGVAGNGHGAAPPGPGRRDGYAAP